MKRIFKSLLFYLPIWVLVSCLMPSMPFGLQAQLLSAQSQPTFTTLSSAIAASAQGGTIRFVVGSATGFVASSGTLDYYAFISDGAGGEALRITAVNGTTITGTRGQFSTNANPHAKGAIVIVGQAGSSQAPGTNGSPFIQTAMTGACTASAYPVLPLFQINARTPGLQQAAYNCNNGVWAIQTLPAAADSPIVATRSCTPPGLQALGLLSSSSFGNTSVPLQLGTSTADVAGRVFYDTVYIPQTTVLTGLSFLIGATGGTDNVDMFLARADGQFLAKTLAGGTLVGSAGRFQDINFVANTVAGQTAFLATGPARYWIAWQGNGTTATLATIDLTPGLTTAGLGAFTGVLGSFLPSTTFDVLPSSLATGAAGSSTAATALPTSLISASGPIACVF